MHFLEIPGEVIDDSVLKYLEWNDLLRLRRVCKWTKGITNAYLRINPDQAPEIEINERKEQTLDSFLAMGIPTTKLFLNNQSGYSFYQKLDEETEHQFMESYGPHVKNLRVTQITLCPFGRELKFITGLKNLKSLEAGYFGPPISVDEWSEKEREILAFTKDDARVTTFRLLKTFQGLQSLKIGQDPISSKIINILNLSGHILMRCPHLKYCSLPYDTTFQTSESGGGGGGEADIYTTLGKAFAHLLLYITEEPKPSHLSEAGTGQQLEYYDFENYHQEMVPWSPMESHVKLLMTWYGSQLFLKVCSRALKMGLKLTNVHPSWFCAKLKEEFGDKYVSPELGISVVSLVGLDPCVMQLDMPNLEKIRIPWTSCVVTGDEHKSSSCCRWPSLKIVDITVDGREGHCWDMDRKTRFSEITRVIHQPTLELFKLLFGVGVLRTNMREVSIRFVEGKEKGQLAVPLMEDVVKSCPNLKKIRLVNWVGSNKQLGWLWSGLLGLEEIYLENCGDLSYGAFMGNGIENRPGLLGLKNLKKLTLKGLDKMPKITDKLFCLVLAKMKLKELVLSSDKPVEKVTKKGIIGLLEGCFAETIERFPFRDWSLADVSKEEFEELGKKFRSYDMI